MKQTPSTCRQDRVRNWAALSYWRRKRKMEARIDEVRTWSLTCNKCDHTGIVQISLRKLRRSNLICSECGVPIKRSARRG